MAKQTFEIIDGVYVGPSVWDGNLDLREYKDTITSLGDLEEVGNWLHLVGCTNLTSLGSLKEVWSHMDITGCTSLTSLGSLKKVGGSLDLRRCTNLLSLGSLTKVGGWMNLEGGLLYLQKIQERVSDYASLPLHEALNALHTKEIQKVPLYRNILLQKLQGG